MPEDPSPLAPTLPSRADQTFPTLTPAQVARVVAHGSVRAVLDGEVLVEAGDREVPFFVVTAGRLEIVRPCGETETLVAVHGLGQFTAANWPLARPPLLLETSRPGIFAVGDVRGGNVKRVASAVGEGSIAVAFVHQVLHE